MLCFSFSSGLFIFVMGATPFSLECRTYHYNVPCNVLAEVGVTLVNKGAVRNSTRGKFTVFPLSWL